MSAERPAEQRREKPVSPEKEEGRYPWITIIGVTGSGKTTLARLMNERLEFTLLEEPDFKKNPFWGESYGVLKSEIEEQLSSFMSQVWFLDEEQRLLMEMITVGKDAKDKDIKIPRIDDLLSKGPIVSEPPIQGHMLYARTRLEEHPNYWRLYTDRFEVYEQTIRRPDFVVYASVEFPEMLRRIRERAEREPERRRELEAPEPYWRRLWELHEEWINQNQDSFRIFTINTKRWDFSFETNNREAQEAVTSEILNWLRYYLVDKKVGGENIIVPEVVLNHRSSVTFISDKPPRSVRPKTPR